MSTTVKIHFQLQQDNEGYPPIAVESVWAQPCSTASEYVVDNVPFFTRDATIGDTIIARESDGNLWFENIVQPSENSLIRVVFFERICVKDVGDHLTLLGCSIEYLQDHGLLAVSIPPTTDLYKVLEYLQTKLGDGSIDYEEAILRQ